MGAWFSSATVRMSRELWIGQDRMALEVGRGMEDARSKVERKHAAGPMARREKARSRERTQRRKHAAEKARSRDGFTQNREVPRRPTFRDDRAESTEQGRNGRHTNRRRAFVRRSELGKS